MNYLFTSMFIWIISFVATFFLFYFLGMNYPQHPFLNSLIVGIFGFSMAYLLGMYLLNSQLIMVPLFF